MPGQAFPGGSACAFRQARMTSAPCRRHPPERNRSVPAGGSRGPRQVWDVFRRSMKGLCAAWCHEASFRLGVMLAVVLSWALILALRLFG
ncbi:hypothetical protein RLIN73S_07450 [Rhodanobacter lindaniclasticus]